MAVQEVMLEHLKVCGHGKAHDTAGTALKGLWPKDEASVIVHRVMMEQLKACGHG